MAFRRTLFAAEYVIDFRGKDAAIRAGYSRPGAAAVACRLLRLPEVQEEIARNMAERSQRIHVNQDRVLQELARLAFFDPRKLFNPDGSPKNINELDDDTAAALGGLDVQEVFEGTGDDRRFVGYVKKYKITDKNTALTNAMRHLNMLKDSVALTGPGGGAIEVNVAQEVTMELSKAIKERLRACG